MQFRSDLGFLFLKGRVPGLHNALVFAKINLQVIV